MTQIRNILNFRWSRQAGWMCAGLVSATGLCGIPFAIPRIFADSINRRIDEDDTVGTASIDDLDADEPESSNDALKTPRVPRITPAYNKTSNPGVDQQVQPVGLWGQGPSLPGEKKQGLLRRRKADAVVHDPFGDEASDDTQLETETMSPKRPSKNGLRSGRDSDEADLTKNQIPDSLASRRRLLKQVETPERAEDQDAGTSSQLLNGTRRKLRDLSAEVEASQKPALDESTSDETTHEDNSSDTTSARPKSLKRRAAALPSKQRIRELFEEPDPTETLEAKTSNKQGSAANQPQFESFDSHPETDVAEDADSANEALSESPSTRELSTTDLRSEGLKLRAQKAREQGRNAAARSLEQTADNIEQLPRSMEPQKRPAERRSPKIIRKNKGHLNSYSVPATQSGHTTRSVTLPGEEPTILQRRPPQLELSHAEIQHEVETDTSVLPRLNASPMRVELPLPQAIANRSIELPPPAGWSAARKFPSSRSPATTTFKTDQDFKANREAQDATPPQIIPPEAGASITRPVILDTIEDFNSERSPSMLQVTTGADDSESTVRDAYYVQNVPTSQPTLAATPELDPILELELERKKVQPTWINSVLALIGTALLSMLLTRSWTGRNR